MLTFFTFKRYSFGLQGDGCVVNLFATQAGGLEFGYPTPMEKLAMTEYACKANTGMGIDIGSDL